MCQYLCLSYDYNSNTNCSYLNVDRQEQVFDRISMRKIIAFVFFFDVVHCTTTNQSTFFTAKTSTIPYRTISKLIWIARPSPNKSLNCIQCGQRPSQCPEPLSRLSKQFLTYPSHTEWCVVSINDENQHRSYFFLFNIDLSRLNDYEWCYSSACLLPGMS